MWMGRRRRVRQSVQPERRPAVRLRDDQGALTLFVVIMFIALLAFAGLVVDAGTKLDDYQNAATYAQEAARAGADQVDLSKVYSSSTIVIDPAEAVSAAQAYLASLPDATGVFGTVTPVGNSAIRVTVTVTSPTKILSIIGIGSVSATSTATATLLSGVTGPGS